MADALAVYSASALIHTGQGYFTGVIISTSASSSHSHAL